MARRLTMGFEEAGTTPWANMLLSAVSAAGNGRNTMVDSGVLAPHSGTYCYRSDVSSATGGSTANITRSTGVSKTSGTAWLAVYFQWHARSTATLSMLEPQNASAVSVYRVALQGSAQGSGAAVLILTNIVATTSATGTVALAADTWYRLELGMTVSATLGTLELRLYLGDSNSVLETLILNGGQNTLNSNLQRLRFGQITGTASAWTFYYDDLRWNDDVDPGDGSNMTWCGPGKIALMGPASNNAVAWTIAGSVPAATNWQGVDDIPGDVDDGVTFNTDSGTTNVDRLNLTPLPAEVPADAVMKCADVIVRAQGEAASQTMIVRMWDEGGATTDSGSIALNNALWGTAAPLVKNLTGKTKQAVNAFNLGYKGNTGASAKDVTAIWVNVEWLESGAPPPPPNPTGLQDIGWYAMTTAWR